MRSDGVPIGPLLDLVNLLSFLERAEEIATSASISYETCDALSFLERMPIRPDHAMTTHQQHSFKENSHKQMSNLTSMKTDQFSASGELNVSNVDPYVQNEPLDLDEGIISTMSPGSLSRELNFVPEDCPTVSPHNTGEFQTCQWEVRFQDLLLYRQEHGHVLVPHSYPPNQKLSRWIKRQRNEYKRKQMGQHSTLTKEREEKLSAVGFLFME
ncbi:helicase domain protein [Nitzschia inconspicua]|uniref:Helicase domain protein n=1 Tax=Nitzschia inconspicua TaxID=303405 RepID=A0A9K3PAT4_9STRA|nr:helicase domain protein [Nitzschia inconspicua]